MMESGKFRMGRWRCYSFMLIEQGLWIAVAVGIAEVTLIVCGFCMSPWIGVASIGFGAFLAVMALTFVIAVYGFNSITGCNMALHSLSLDEEGVTVIFEDEKTLRVDLHDIRPYRIYPGGVLVPVIGIRAGWLWIPPHAFEEKEDFENFITGMYRKLPASMEGTGDAAEAGKEIDTCA